MTGRVGPDQNGLAIYRPTQARPPLRPGPSVFIPFPRDRARSARSREYRSRRTPYPPFFASQASIWARRSFRIFIRYSMFAIAVSVGRREPAARFFSA